MIGNIVLCSRKTASASISRSWSRVSREAVFHTHDMKYFIVTDKPSSDYYSYSLATFPENVSRLQKFGDMVEYTIISDDLESVFGLFDRFVVVSTLRDPLSRRISELLQAITVDQINAVMNDLGIEGSNLDTDKQASVQEICHMSLIMGDKFTCPILRDALHLIVKNEKLLNYEQVGKIFDTHFVKTDTLEYTTMFEIMEKYFSVDFDLDVVDSDGYQLLESQFLRKPVTQGLFKIEMLNSEAFHKLTSIETLSREHDARDSHHIFFAPVGMMKLYLNNRFGGTVLSPQDSIEGKISEALWHN